MPCSVTHAATALNVVRSVTGHYHERVQEIVDDIVHEVMGETDDDDDDGLPTDPQDEANEEDEDEEEDNEHPPAIEHEYQQVDMETADDGPLEARACRLPIDLYLFVLILITY